MGLFRYAMLRTLPFSLPPLPWPSATSSGPFPNLDHFHGPFFPPCPGAPKPTLWAGLPRGHLGPCERPTSLVMMFIHFWAHLLQTSFTPCPHVSLILVKRNPSAFTPSLHTHATGSFLCLCPLAVFLPVISQLHSLLHCYESSLSSSSKLTSTPVPSPVSRWHHLYLKN